MNKVNVHCIAADRSIFEIVSKITGIELPKPTHLYTLTQCGECGEDCWIGPRQSKVIESLPDALVLKLCTYCCITNGMTDPNKMINLGGGHNVEGVPRG